MFKLRNIQKKNNASCEKTIIMKTRRQLEPAGKFQKKKPEECKMTAFYEYDSYRNFFGLYQVFRNKVVCG